MMANSRSAAAGTSVLALGVALAGLAALALATPERMIGGSVAASLGRAAPVLPVAGSEAFWLSDHATAADASLHGAWGRAFALGDQITIGAAGDLKRVLEVVELRELPSAVLRASDANSAAKLTLVTCRDEAGALVRFIVETEHAVSNPPKAAQEKLL